MLDKAVQQLLRTLALAMFGLSVLADADDPRWFNFYPESGAIAWRESPRYPARAELLREQRAIAVRVLACASAEPTRGHPRQLTEMRIPVVFDPRTGGVLWPRSGDGHGPFYRCTNEVARTMHVRGFAASEPVGVWFPLDGTSWLPSAVAPPAQRDQ
jgi:hypothetical protein